MRNEMRREMWEHVGKIYDIAIEELKLLKLKGRHISKEEELKYIQKRLRDAGVSFTIEEVNDMY